MAQQHQQTGGYKMTRVLIDFREKIVPQDETPVIKDKTCEMINIRKKIEKEQRTNKNVQLVMCVADPFQTVIAKLFVNGFPEKNYSLCSTELAMQKFLRLPLDYELSTKLEQLAFVIKDEDVL